MTHYDIPAYAHGGRFKIDPPAFHVIHSTEGPMAVGNAKGLADWFARSPANNGPGTSATDIFDPRDDVTMLDDHTVPFHVGPEGNPISTGSEHCGSVKLTREQWLSPAGQSMLDMSARKSARRAHLRGFTLSQCRWLTITQVAQRNVKGFCTHNDVRLALGGTTHSDPGPNFPYDWYMNRVRSWYTNPNGTEEDMPYNDWPQADKDALVSAVVSGVIRAVTRGEMPDGSAPQHLVDASTGKIVEWVKILQLGDGPSVDAASDTHAPNLKTITALVTPATPTT